MSYGFTIDQNAQWNQLLAQMRLTHRMPSRRVTRLRGGAPPAPAAQPDTSTWVVIAADGSSIPYGLASADILATNPTVRTPQGDYAYSELATLYGFASAPTSDGVPFIPGFINTPGASMPGWVLPVALIGGGLIILTQVFR